VDFPSIEDSQPADLPIQPQKEDKDSPKKKGMANKPNKNSRFVEGRKKE
jgi:hypothetical protein